MASCFSSQGAVDSLGTFTLTGNGGPEIVPLMHVTASIFPMLGVKPLLGGLFSTEEEQPSRHHVAVISEKLWKRRYSSDTAIVGKDIQINQESYHVVGVIAPILAYRFAADIWIPMTFSPADLTSQASSLSIHRRHWPAQARIVDPAGKGCVQEYRCDASRTIPWSLSRLRLFT
jgi:hypothetical protein